MIRIIQSEGNTSALLEWLREPTHPAETRVFVAHSRHEAMRVLQQERVDADRDGRQALESWRFVCFDEAMNHKCWAGIRGDIVIGIDNIELVLTKLFRRDVEAITVTKEPTP